MLLHSEEVLCNYDNRLENGNKNAEACRGKAEGKKTK
jgi:hypothetical protein